MELCANRPSAPRWSAGSEPGLVVHTQGALIKLGVLLPAWRRGFSKQPRISPGSWASSLNPRLVAKLVADSATREGFPQTGGESASSLKPSRNDCVGLRGTVKENGGGPLQTSALPLGYGAGRNVSSQLTMSSARVGLRTVSPESRPVAVTMAGSSGSARRDRRTHRPAHRTAAGAAVVGVRVPDGACGVCGGHWACRPHPRAPGVE
jgi:hypothetical protein